MSESNFLSYDKKDLLSKCANIAKMYYAFMYTEGKAAGLKAFE